MRPNKHPGRCVECQVSVARGEGTLAKRPDRWDTVCSGALCRQLVYGLEAPANPRMLRADGTIPLPHKGPDTPLLNAIATWDQPAGVWRAPFNDRDSALVVELCQRMGVEIAEGWWLWEQTPERARALATTERAADTSGGRDYQVTGSRWLHQRSRALLADDMGLGKGKQFLDAVYYLNLGVLIICPAVVKGVWEREIQKWCPDDSTPLWSARGGGRFAGRRTRASA